MILAAVDWANLNTAAAFVAGAVLGCLGTIRVVRAVAAIASSYRPDEPRQ